MYCKYCGKEIDDNSTFCKECGKNQQESQATYAGNTANKRRCPSCNGALESYYTVCPYCGAKVSQTDSSKAEVAGLVLGILGLIAWLLPLIGFPVTVTGMILSGRGMNERKKYAQAGLILSVLCFIATLINSISGAIMFSQY